MTGAAFRERYGPWALVAGASEGLGEAFARALAARGLDLVLVARRAAPLRALAARLRREHGVEARAVAIDLSRRPGPAALLRAVARLEIGLLVAGAARSPIGPFLALPPAELDGMLDLNCRAPACLALGLGGRMAARGRGGIVLLGSMAGFQGAARVAHYAATKAYLQVLAEGLWAELGPAGVDALACCAGPVRTPTFERSAARRIGLLAPPVMEADAVAAETLAALGRGPIVIPGTRNRCAAALTTRLLPRRTAVALVSAATRAMYPAPGRAESRPRRARARGAG
ncbi:MAG TPA: SDR family NAD(P)-dependent oxidoreductase [Anaeromyxobacter sp.]|nr:SDR family NAD(P)-dependent oxidoreductase [Anaeromyxobacter sp.]